ncbi:MAG: class I SAM-dependent methyltransferase [Rhodothalassiaceae bacterium]
MSSTPEPGSKTAHFGSRLVPKSEKGRLVRGVFKSVADRYDLMNDLMSGGLHRLWKASLIDSLAPRPGMRLIDVAGGTGDIAFRFLKASAGRGHVTVVDINEAMLDVGRRRLARAPIPGEIEWLCADAEALPLPEGAFDAYTIAFGIRNVTHRERALAEARRVLGYGGRFLCLEFCPHLALPFLDRLYARYSERVIPTLGRWVAGDADSYVYLVESIRRFPPPEAFAAEIAAAGFGRIRYRLLSGGVCAIHSGWKI